MAINSKTDICNLALTRLNQERITDIDSPQSKTADLCALYYDQTRKEVLEDGVFNFSLKRSSLARLTTTPAFEYAYEYELPNDFIKLVYIGIDLINKVEDYEIEGNKILIDNLGGSTTTALPIRYVFNATDVSKFSPSFIESLSLKLALHLCKPLTGANTDQDRMKALYDESIARAKAIDGQQRPPRVMQRSKLMNARLGTYETDNTIVRTY